MKFRRATHPATRSNNATLKVGGAPNSLRNEAVAIVVGPNAIEAKVTLFELGADDYNVQDRGDCQSSRKLCKTVKICGLGCGVELREQNVRVCDARAAVASLLIEGRWIVGQLVVRNLENAVKTCLQRRAKRHGRSMEEEVRDILRSAVSEEEIPSGGLGTDISRLFAKTGLDLDVPELRGRAIKPATFES